MLLPEYTLHYPWEPYSLSSTASIYREHIKQKKKKSKNKIKKHLNIVVYSLSFYLQTSLSILGAFFRESFPHYKNNNNNKLIAVYLSSIPNSN